MIDEFQDTDAIQYNIFSTVYFNQGETSLTLIGDPKQAIYSFRGGDIFTYMQARQAPNLLHCILHTNWRSQPGLVRTVNHVFSYRSDPFIYSDSIDYLPVASAEVNRSSFLTINEQRQSALTLWKIPSAANGKALSKENASEHLCHAVANEIFALLRQDSDHRVCIEGRNITAGDIAILVRTGEQGKAIRRALETRGITAVTIGKDKVFNSEEAAGLIPLLGAVVFPRNRNRLRQALASELLYYDHHKILEISADDTAWQIWTDRFQRLHQLWITRGFIPMFQQILRTFGLAEKLAERNQPERRLTNLLHLGEILQQQSLQSSGIDNLFIWFQQQRQQSLSEEAELRLESDRDLVKIITIHKSKGLEFPVVFLPFMWDCRAIDPSKDQPIYFHDSSFEVIMDLGSEQLHQHRIKADRERLAEDLRLLYVALTRARSKNYLAWGVVGDKSSRQSALAYLLHSSQTPEQLSRETANGVQDPPAIDQDLLDFVGKANGDIELLELATEIAGDKLLDTGFKNIEIEAATASLELKQNWRVNSFSGLTRDIHQPVTTAGRQTSGDTILDFPAGSNVGLFLHAVLEDLDFRGDIDSQCRRLVPRYASRYGLDADNFTADVGCWLSQVIHTELMQPGMSLSVLSSDQRLNELPFDFAVDYADIDRINYFFSKFHEHPHNAISAQDFRGLVTGFIDLVYEFDGRYYLADYKSNYLGNRLDDYNPASLGQAMLERRYDLQLMIYSVALHRYLRQRIVDYQYDSHFGGAYYLFLRAMRQQSGNGFGVYFERPPRDRIEALDSLFSHIDRASAT